MTAENLERAATLAARKLPQDGISYLVSVVKPW